jgi:hypothetical protein
LQGLAFWVSYKQVLYHLHSLKEGALVAEFVHLLNAKLGKNFKIHCESLYDKHKGLQMDVEIRENDQRVAVIEFKRNLAGKRSIDKDIKKLLSIKEGNILRFLVVVSEKKRPKEYVNNKGRAVTKNLCGQCGSSAKVIGVFKSAQSFNGKNKNLPVANYCCLIEIKSQNSPINGGKK